MEIRLVIEKNKRRLRAHQLTGKETVIGRRQDCSLCIRSSEVSRRHCVLTFENDSLFVEDLDSVNGTLINGKRITGKQALQSGDHLGIGPVQFLVEFGPPPKRLDRPKAAKVADPDDEGLPVGKIEAAPSQIVFPEEDDALDALPLPDEEDETEQADAATSGLALADDETLSKEDDEGVTEDWKMPGSDDLRKLLSGLDDVKSRRRRK